MAENRNHLADEKSPYLQQHASNPVNWHPWGDEAFAKAKAENKPIFLSIGYATCHWCHVMEHESFEDNATAAFLNKHFVSIKVDREERPDIDKIYMDIVLSTTGRGGWPLSVFLTPEGKPIYGGTYFPKESKWGMVRFIDISESILDAWQNKRGQVMQSADGIIDNVTNRRLPAQKTEITESILDKAYQSYAASFDPVFGGFSRAPKFPSPHNLQLLLRYAQKNPESQALEMATTTLTRMYHGGIFDQLGGGFHRYSVDPLWRVPHFEKMLYDQAGLATAYTEAWLITKNPLFKDAVRKTLEYVKNDMLSEEGTFYSAEDADSYTSHRKTDKKEGAFYLWSWAELKRTLSPEEFSVVEHAYNIKEEGNIKEDPHGEFKSMNILHTENITTNPILEQAKTKLLSARGSRIRPQLDNKSLVSWNGMMISAYAKAANAFNNDEYKKIAENAATFILSSMMDKNYVLKHRYIHGEAAIDGMLEDYAFFTAALIDLYQVNYEIDYLSKAKHLTDKMIELFWDEENYGFYSTSSPSIHFAKRQKIFDDNAVPSANSIAAMMLIRLARILRSTDYGALAEQLFNSISTQINSSPRAFPATLTALEFEFGPAREFIIAEGIDPQLAEKIDQQIKLKYIPNSVRVRRPFNMHKDSKESDLMPWLVDMQPDKKEMRLFVCENFTCNLPINGYENIKIFVSELGQ